MENDPDVVAMVAASAALTLSGLPFLGPIAASRVGYAKGQYILNPTVDQMEETELDLVVAGTGDAVLMVESEAKELSGEDHARRGDLRPGRLQACYRCDHKLGRGCGERALGCARDEERVRGQGQEALRARPQEGVADQGKQDRNNKVAEAKAKAVALLTAESTAGDKVKLAGASRRSRRTSSGRASSRLASASTAAIWLRCGPSIAWSM